jgi:signal peptidase I
MGARSVVLVSIIVAVVMAMGLMLFVVDFPRTASDDMLPNLRKGDLLLACRVCGRPQRGDVVLFTAPDGGPLTIRRVVGVPGDRVEVRAGQTLVNGKPLTSETLGNVRLAGIDPVSTEPRSFAARIEHGGTHDYEITRDHGVAQAGDRAAVTLEDAYFVLADRRTLVRDSRDYGPVPHAAMRSIVLRVLQAGDHDGARDTKVP